MGKHQHIARFDANTCQGSIQGDGVPTDLGYKVTGGDDTRGGGIGDNVTVLDTTQRIDGEHILSGCSCSLGCRNSRERNSLGFNVAYRVSCGLCVVKSRVGTQWIIGENIQCASSGCHCKNRKLVQIPVESGWV